MKNKFILSFVLGILLIGLVSASITGYLTRGEKVTDAAGYTATLEKVDARGTATISVTNPAGDINVVRVGEGETAKVGDAEISASSLTKRTLFRRGGGKIGLNISNISVGPTPIKVPGGVNVGEAVTGAHTHLINPQQIMKYNPSVAGTQTTLGENVSDSNNYIVGKLFNLKLECPNNKALIDGGFVINHAGGSAYPYPDNYVVLANAPAEWNAYLVTIFQSASANTKISSVTLEMICAELETAIGSGEPHF